MQVELVSSRQDFQRLQVEWNQLAANFHSPLLRHEWVASCLEALHSKHVVSRIFVLRSNGKLRAAAPFVSIRRTIMPKLEIPGAYDLCEPCGFIYESDEDAKILVTAIMNAQQSFHLSRFGRETVEALMVRDLPAKGFIRIIRDGASTLRIPLRRTWNEFEASMSPKRRSDLRRYYRRAEKLGTVEFNAVDPEPHDLALFMEELFRIEASGWKGEGGSAILSRPQTQRFFEHYARSAAEQKMLRIFFLRIGGKNVAARLAVEHSGRLWDLKLGYDETFSKCAPGVLLTHETLRYAVGRGLDAYEFLGRAEVWERHWPCEEDNFVSMHIYPLSLAGQLSFIQDGCRSVSVKAFSAGRNALNRAMRAAAERKGTYPAA